MKDIKTWFVAVFTAVLFFASYGPCKALVGDEVKLKSFEVNKQRFSTQFVFDFSTIPSVRFRAIPGENLFELEFVGANENDFDSQNVIKKLSSLALIESVDIVFEPKQRCVKIALKMDPNKTSVRVNQYKELKQVVLDIYSKRSLDRLVEQQSRFLEVASLSAPQSFTNDIDSSFGNNARLGCFSNWESQDRVLLVSRNSSLKLRFGRCGAGREVCDFGKIELVDKTRQALGMEGLRPFCLRDQQGNSIADHVKFAQSIGARMMVKLDTDDQMSFLTSSIALCEDAPGKHKIKVLRWDALDQDGSGFSGSTARTIARKTRQMRDAQQNKLSLGCMNFTVQISPNALFVC